MDVRSLKWHNILFLYSPLQVILKQGDKISSNYKSKYVQTNFPFWFFFINSNLYIS